MSYMAKLAKFITDHQVSPVGEPDRWLNANISQVLAILADFYQAFPSKRKPLNYASIFGVKTLYPVGSDIARNIAT
jgi:hypothetical protein